MSRHRHLTDDELLTLVERPGDIGDLANCEECSLRHAQVLSIFAEEPHGLHTEADALFDDARLAHQRAHILRRLERNHGPARVLPFPAAAPMSGSTLARAGGLGLGRRWMAAAAIGGLMVGLFTGRLLNPRDHSELARQALTADVRPQVGDMIPADLRSSVFDDHLLVEVEAALDLPHPVELRAIDALTPVAR